MIYLVQYLLCYYQTCKTLQRSADFFFRVLLLKQMRHFQLCHHHYVTLSLYRSLFFARTVQKLSVLPGMTLIHIIHPPDIDLY